MATPTNIRSLVPRVRRAVEGPVPLPAPLSDDVIKDMVADALADVILYAGTVFGKQIIVTTRDAVSGAPTEYQTSDLLTVSETAVIASQAALNFFFYKLAGMKTEERITDEAGEWQYRTSVNLMRDAMTALKDARDKALEALQSVHPLETYASFLAVRDSEVSRLVEPWVFPELDVGGQAGGALILQPDVRFGGY